MDKNKDKKFKVVITDHAFYNIEQEKELISAAGGNVELLQTKDPETIAEKSKDADAIMVQWAQINSDVINKLENCKLLVRYGIGTDNIDLKAAKAKGIPVCNVPDYCIDEVADHTMALVLSLTRQIPFIERKFRNGTFDLKPVTEMYASRELRFSVAGFGRIARAVIERARNFKFKLGAYDPFLSDEVFEKFNVKKLTSNEFFEESDIISLHIPLIPETKHFINEKTIELMKPNAILINTSRGPLVDTVYLAQALKSKKIAYAGIDVFETEPLPKDHPLLGCDNAVLTCHTAYYSESSMPMLQRFAAEEVVRVIKGEPLKNRVD